jgi:hypothetical protein
LSLCLQRFKEFISRRWTQMNTDLSDKNDKF